MQKLLEMNPTATVIAIGNASKIKLNEIGIPCLLVAHPSMGGTPNFKRGLSSIVSNL